MTDYLVRHFVKRYEDVRSPEVRESYGFLAGIVGILLNLLLSVGKFFAGLVTGSISITADAFNNLSDAGSSVVTLVGFRLAGLKADKNHPFGHGRIEYLAGLAVSLLILVVGLELGKSSIEKIISPQQVDFTAAAMVILVISIAMKLWMWAFNRTLSKRISSPAMAATAADCLSDAAATGAVLLGAVIGHLTHLPVDGWMGILVSVFILRAGWGAARDTISPLLGQTPDPQLVKEIEKVVLSHKAVCGMHDLVIHDYGPGRAMMSFHAEVPMSSDIMEAHDAIDHIERELKERFGILTSVHMDPIATNDMRVNGARARVEELVKKLDPALTIHDFRMTEGPQFTNLIFDVVTHADCALDDKALAEEISRQVKELSPGCYAVIQVDHPLAEAAD